MLFWNRWKLKNLLKKAKRELSRNEQGQQGNVEEQIQIELKLARFYEKYRYDKSVPFAYIHALEHYRCAANLGSPVAQYHFGFHKLEQGKLWDSYIKGDYSRPIHQTYAKACFEEAFNYLQEASAGNEVLAMRTLGLAYINGWGVEVNKEKGFQLVVDSIDKANAWDKAPELFKKLGLNNPEFFATMMAARGKRREI